MADADDEPLVVRAKAGDRAAFASLVTRHGQGDETMIPSRSERRLAAAETAYRSYLEAQPGHRAEALAALRSAMEELSLESLVEKLEKLGDLRWGNAKPSIRIGSQRADENTIPLGTSKLGGQPDLPPGVAWPARANNPLSFLAQLRMDDVAAHESESVLPHSGMLYFFYDATTQPWGFDPADRGSSLVLHYDRPGSSLTRRPLPAGLPEGAKFRASVATFRRELTYPDPDSETASSLGVTVEEEGVYARLLDGCLRKPEAGGRVDRMLGWPDLIQGDMELECELVSRGLSCGDGVALDDPETASFRQGASEWRLLLQLDCDEDFDEPGTMWWGHDIGRLYFWIKAGDLQRRDFANVWTILQCH